MKISFDLDDLIIPGIKKFETEPQTIIQRFFRSEKVRKGILVDAAPEQYETINTRFLFLISIVSQLILIIMFRVYNL